MTLTLPHGATPDPLAQLERRFPLPGLRLPAVLLVLMVAALAAASFIARLDQVVIAAGQVIPNDRVKLVQHLEGGILSELHIREGQLVAQGDPLLQLDLGSRGLNRDEIALRLDGLQLQVARLQAEALGQPLALPAELTARRSLLADAETTTWSTRQDQLRGTMEVHRTVLEQRHEELQSKQVELAGLRDSLVSAREQLRIQRNLAAQQLANRQSVLSAEREAKDLEGRAATLEADLPRVRAAIAQAKAQLAQADTDFRTAAAEEAGRVALEVARHQEMLAEASRQADRTTIRAPIAGIVENIRFNTIGGVIGPGEPILEIVPVGDTLVVEARLSPIDIGMVKQQWHQNDSRLPAVVKLTTYDFTRYGALEGWVTDVGANADSDQDGNQFYRVLVETRGATLEAGGENLPIIPGMQAQVDIHTGERRVIDFLIQPVLKLRAEAFREP